MRSFGVLAAFALAGLSLAGCTDNPVEDTDVGNDPIGPADSGFLRTLVPVATAKLTGSGAADPRQQDIGFEPSIEVGPDGTIYVTAAQGAVVPTLPPSRLWVSWDNGATFTEIPAIDPTGAGVSNLPSGAEGDVAVAYDGTAYFVELAETANVPITRSTDSGHTWEMRNPAVFALSGGDREWVAAGPGQLVAVTWNQLAGAVTFGGVGAPNPWVAVSSDGGLTFPVQTPILDGGGSSAGGIAVGPDGSILVSRAPDGEVTAHVSADGGLTFTRTVVRTAQGDTFLMPFADIDLEGNMYVSWSEMVGNYSRAYYAYSGDGGATWSQAIEAADHGGASVMVHVDAAEAGHILVSYYCAPGEPGAPEEVDGDWHVCAADIRDANTPNPRIDLVQLTTKTVGEGKVCTGGLTGGCEGDERNLGDYLQGALGPDGSVHVSWATKDRDVYWGMAKAGVQAVEA